MSVPTQIETSVHIERHYAVAEIAELWNLSPDKVRELFENEPGVFIIAVTVMCKEGIVIGADSLMTHDAVPGQGAFAHYEKKVHTMEGRYFAAAVSGAGDSFLLRTFSQNFLTHLKSQESKDASSLPNVENTLKDELTELAHTLNGAPNLSLLVGYTEPPNRMQLYKTSEIMVQEAKPIEIVGIGEMSLVQYLKDTLYNPSISLRQAVALAIFIVSAGKQYCPQFCGGQTSIEIIKTDYPLWDAPSQKEIESIEEIFKSRSKTHLRALLESAARLLT